MVDSFVEQRVTLGITSPDHYGMNSLVTKRMNFITVMEYLYQKGEGTAQAIAIEIGLSIPTVMSIIKALVEKEIIHKTRQLKSSGGRRAAVYAVNYNAFCAIGIDVYESGANIVLINLNADIIADSFLDLPFVDNQEYWDTLKKLSDEFLRRNQPESSKFLGASFSLPCVFRRDNLRKVELSRKLSPPDKPIELDYLYAAFGEDTMVMNNGRLAGMSAVWNKALDKSTVYILLNKEISGTVFPVYQSLVLGERAGEFGHSILYPNGKQCVCGNKGCLNCYCSASVLLEKSGIAIEKILDEKYGKCDESGVDLKEFFRFLDAGNETIAEIWGEYLRDLAVYINNLRMILDCDVILGGFVSGYLKSWESVLKDKVDTMNCFGEKCDYLTIAEYGRYDSCVGAGIRVIAKFLAELDVE